MILKMLLSKNKGMKNIILITGLLLMINIKPSSAQIDTLFLHEHLTFEVYLQKVSSGNLEYAANRYNVSIADAKVQAAKVFPDPYVNFEWIESREKEKRSGYGYTTEIGTTVRIAGQRRAAIDLAQNEYQLSLALLDDYFRNLRAESALAFLNCHKQRQLYSVFWDSYQTMKKLSEADSVRYKLGSIMEIDATQSKVEAGVIYNDLLLAAAEWRNAIIGLTAITGRQNADTLIIPAIQFTDSCRLFSMDNLIEQALNSRSDLMAARKNMEVSEKNLALVKKERAPDLDLYVNFSNAMLTDESAPPVKGITGGISVPLKFSGLNKGEVRMSQGMVSQSEKLYEQVGLQIRAEVSQAWNLYYVYCRQVENFERGLLRSASEVMNGKIYSYKRGENSLLEVLNAQRTYNNIQTAYYEALYNRAAALVNLERSAGIWDIRF
jgi:cobalt-zinc-cadmium efflux system outer membrane protein